MSYSPIKLPIRYIEEFRKCVNNNDHLILNNERYYKTWNILCACMSRIEDTARYLNSKTLGEKHDYGCAFDLIEFLLHSGSMLNCIDTMIKTLKAQDSFDIPAIIFKGKLVTNQAELRKQLARTRKNRPYKNEDDLYFEYIRSISAAHPDNTDHHPYFQQYIKEVSPFLVWNSLLGITGGDISLHIYGANGEEDIHSLKIQLTEIYAYIIDRYNRLLTLKSIFCSQINDLIAELKSQKILPKRNFDNYNDFLSYLKAETHKRSDYLEYCIDKTKKMLYVDGIPNELSKKYLKYRNALIYSMDNLKELIQGPILSDGYDEKILAEELHLPRILREDETKMTCYYYEKSTNLYSEERYGEYDIYWFKSQAKNLYEIVKKYAQINKKTLDCLNSTQLLTVLNIALYFYSLNHDTFINKKIPRSNKYR